MSCRPGSVLSTVERLGTIERRDDNRVLVVASRRCDRSPSGGAGLAFLPDEEKHAAEVSDLQKDRADRCIDQRVKEGAV